MTLPGAMMREPLLLARLIERAGRTFGSREVVSRRADADVVRQGWGETLERVRRLAGALVELGVQPGDRVATMAWNGHRHLELYFAVPAIGAVLHTLNVRLSPEQLGRIVDHAGDRILFADPGIAAAAGLRDRSPALETIVAVDGAPPEGWLDFEELLSSAGPVQTFADLPEDAAAALCYTSGTTGEPKGVLYSHRALVLHTLAICLPDAFGLGERDVILPAVPMFHANAWGLPFAAAMTGAGLVLPGPHARGEDLVGLAAGEGVTFGAAVPTVWMGVLDALRAGVGPTPTLRRIHSGGAPTPPALIRSFAEEWGIEVVTGWGMTELSPVGMVCHPRKEMEGWDADRLTAVRTSQGTPLPLVEARVVDDGGHDVPPDGATPGELRVRGPWVAADYYGGGTRSTAGAADAFAEGWLRTGDVATVDELGYVRLVDRTKDLIRSGGEWISSVQLENALMDHPDVAEAAVVGVPDPRWQERPLACVVLRPGAGSIPDDALLATLDGRFPAWWRPDRIVRLEAIPRTATGKFDKRGLRRRFGAG